MNVFEAVKEIVTARQAAEAYGLTVHRNSMALCPFHQDKNPSMKLDERYYCFGCGATGDAVDLTAHLFGIPVKEAAMKLADDFGIAYDRKSAPSVRPRSREPTAKQKYRQEEHRCFRVLLDYLHKLRAWETELAPKQPDEPWHPLFVEALQRKSYIEYLLDVLMSGTSEEKKTLVAEQSKEVKKLERRFGEHSTDHDRGRNQRKSGLDR